MSGIRVICWGRWCFQQLIIYTLSSYKRKSNHKLAFFFILHRDPMTHETSWTYLIAARIQVGTTIKTIDFLHLHTISPPFPMDVEVAIYIPTRPFKTIIPVEKGLDNKLRTSVVSIEPMIRIPRSNHRIHENTFPFLSLHTRS